MGELRHQKEKAEKTVDLGQHGKMEAEISSLLPVSKEALLSQASTSLLDQIPCLKEIKSNGDANASHHEQLCYLSISRSAIKEVLKDPNRASGESLMQMLSAPKNFSEALAARAIFDGAEPSIYQLYHQLKETHIPVEQLDKLVEKTLDKNLITIKFIVSLETTLLNKDIQQLLKNHKGSIRLPDIKSAMQKKDINPELKESLEFLDNSYEFLLGGPYDDYAKLEQRTALLPNSKDAGISISRMASMLDLFADSLVTLDGTRSIINAIRSEEETLYRQADDPLRSIVPSAINQTNVSAVCVPLSVIASLASTPRRAEIQKWIQQQSDGTFLVRLPGTNEYTVPKPALSRKTMFNESSPHGLWSATVLSAFSRSLPCQEAQCTQLEKLMPEYKLNLTGGMDKPELAIQAFTGHIAYRLTPAQRSDLSGLNKTIADALNENRVVTVGITGGEYVPAPKKGIATGHAYSVVELKNDSITIRDPMGKNTLNPGGPYLKMPLSDFAKAFNLVTIESSEPLKK